MKNIYDDTPPEVINTPPPEAVSPENVKDVTVTSPEKVENVEDVKDVTSPEKVSVTSPEKVSVTSPEQEFEFKLNKLEKDVRISYDAFKDLNFVDSSLLLQLLNAENTFLIFLIKESKNYRNLTFKEYLKDVILKSPPEFMILETKDLRLNDTKESIFKKKEYSDLFENLLTYLGSLRNIERKITTKGGAGSILPVEVELSKQNDLDFNSFLEKTIYIKPDKRLMYTSVSGSNKIPIIGYFTIGKNLLLKMVEYQTNNKASFTSEEQLEEIKKRDAARRKASASAGGGEKGHKKYYKTKNKRYYKLKTKKRR